MAVSLQGGLVLCGDGGVHLLSTCGHVVSIRELPGNRPPTLQTVGGPGRSGGGRSVAHLCF